MVGGRSLGSAALRGLGREGSHQTPQGGEREAGLEGGGLGLQG